MKVYFLKNISLLLTELSIFVSIVFAQVNTPSNPNPSPYPTSTPFPVPNPAPNPIIVPPPVVTTPSPITTPNRVPVAPNTFPQQSRDTIFRNPEDRSDTLHNPVPH